MSSKKEASTSLKPPRVEQSRVKNALFGVVENRVLHMAKSKPYQAPLSKEIADEILGIPLPPDEGEPDPSPAPQTVGEKLEQALDALAEVVEEANEALANHKVADIVADSLAKSLKKRGNASIRVSKTGEVVLHVSYDEPRRINGHKPTAKVVKSKWKSDLPKLDELRRQAEELGVDIEHLGRKRRAIYELLEKKRSINLRQPKDAEEKGLLQFTR